MKDELKLALKTVHEVRLSAEDFNNEVGALGKGAGELLDLLCHSDWHRVGEKIRDLQERARVTLGCINELADKAGLEQ